MKPEIERNLKFYDNNAEAWANRRANSFHREKDFLRYIKYFKKGDTIVDIGCASGTHVPLFLGMGRHLKYEGIDISKKLLKIAKRRYPQLKFRYGNIVDKKTLPVKSFKGFWAVAVLMHIPEQDWDKMLLNIEKMCFPGAVGYIVLPRRRPGEANKHDRRFFTYWDKAKTKKYLDRARWKLLSSGKIDSDQYGEWSWYIVRLPKT